MQRVASGEQEVWVVDGRPRFHIRSCHHLAGRETEPLPVWEAIELEFTPCALCTPMAALAETPQAKAFKTTRGRCLAKLADCAIDMATLKGQVVHCAVMYSAAYNNIEGYIWRIVKWSST